ncbi:MAG: hypothetical protein MUD12_15890 [Spirochaetes bacterium]|nr:hypothetical protein [Spirochaetota bacterium]
MSDNDKNTAPAGSAGCGCGYAPKPGYNRAETPHWADGTVDTPAGPVIRASGKWTRADEFNRDKIHLEMF